jgi:hypothetical protein
LKCLPAQPGLGLVSPGTGIRLAFDGVLAIDAKETTQITQFFLQPRELVLLHAEFPARIRE